METDLKIKRKTSLNKGDRFKVLKSFKGFEQDKKYTVERIHQFRWSGEYCYYAYTVKNDLHKTPELTLFYTSDLTKIIKL